MTPEQTLELSRAVLTAREGFTQLLLPVGRLADALEGVGEAELANRLSASVLILDEELTKARRLVVADDTMPPMRVVPSEGS